MYRAIVFFKDAQDDMRAYNPGDIFPREGLEVTPKRIEELSTDKNRRGKAVIEEIEEPKVEVVADAIDEKDVEADQAPSEKPKPKRGRKKKDAD